MSDTKSDSRHRLIALFVTVAFHVAVAVLLITLYLQPVASDMERKWPPWILRRCCSVANM